MKNKAITEKTNTGYSAEIHIKDGIIASTGKTIDDLKTNLREGLELSGHSGTIEIIMRR